MKHTQSLYRPVGVQELQLILGANAQGFPPRLYWQPIFYPVLNLAYAAQIARDWNTQDDNSGYAGFVTSFDLPTSYLSKFEVQTVGGTTHQELWIAAEELTSFNDQLIGPIEIVAAYYGPNYTSNIHTTTTFHLYWNQYGED
ncbi:MAG: ADP-ribosylation/crystallin J1 [Bacteroidota bacterium]